MIKGWIVENKGNVINQAKAIATTTQEKAQGVSSSSLPRAPGEKSN